MYIYQAATYCDDCGLAIIQDLNNSGVDDILDSDDYPQWGPDDQEFDGPYHCASYDQCKDPIFLGDYGLDAYAPLYGSEKRFIGSLLSERLTPHGVEYLKELLERDLTNTPYQKALHNFWREAFADYLGE